MACLLAFAQQTAISIGGDYVQGGVQKGVNIVINQFRYMCRLKQFEEELKEEAQALSVVQQEVDRILQKESKDNKVPDEPVADWKTRTNKAMDDVHRLQNEIREDKRCFGNWCPNLLWRRRISKQAQELSASLKNLKEERSGFKTLTHDPDLPNIELIGSKDFIPSKASKSALADIINALQTDGVNVIGLHGMPGVGKTTLAKQVKNEAEKLRLFDEFIFVTVTEKPEFNAIQSRIAEQLQVKFVDQDSLQQRASKLMLRLQDEKKKLLVLDDVWQEINLNQIGIPSVDDLKKCTILLTTRRIPVCEAMNCQRKILLDILTQGEAWALFKFHAHLEDDSSLINVAKNVAKECGRLPVAIKSVAKCLKGKPRHEWERAQKKLQEGEHQELRDMNKGENAYKSIKFSFDELATEPTKRCLLLCCLFPEDYDISVEDLGRYAHGLGLYKSSSDQSIEYTMSEVLAAVGDLKDSHLLLEGESEGYVKMHDLTRDVVLLIGSKVEEFKVATLHKWPTDEIRYRDYTAISLSNQFDKMERVDTDYPRLELLFLGLGNRNFETDNFSLMMNPETKQWAEQDLTREWAGATFVDTKFVQGMQKLEVLSVFQSQLSIQSIECLKNIRTLELICCSFTPEDNFASLGNLKSLEILIFHSCRIKQLPDNIGELKNLKLLQLTRCFEMEIIPSNLIRKLTKMEELHFGDYTNWNEVEEGKSNVSPMELNSLPNLTILSLAYPEDIPENFSFSGKLTGYHLQLGTLFSPKSVRMLRHPKSRIIGLKATKVNVNACKKQFEKAYILSVEDSSVCFKNMIPDMSQNGFQDLSHLVVRNCKLKCIISTNQQQVAAADSFSKLEKLKIDCTDLEQICEGWPTEGFLKKLRKLIVLHSSQMMTIFPAKLMRGMPKLESVVVGYCENLEDVFQLDDGIDEANNDCLSQLTSLELGHLNGLKCIWNGRSIHHVNLKCLTHLGVFYCQRLSSLFPVSIAQTLVHLETLDVEFCDDLKHIIAEKEEDSISKAPQQQNLSEVGYMFSRNCVVILPSFRLVRVTSCPKLLMHSLVRLPLKQVFPYSDTDSVRIPLEEVHLDGCSQLEHIISKENINAHFPPVCFTYLRFISIDDCKKLKTLLPISIITSRSLAQLESLIISRCDELVEVFELENEADNIVEEIQFPKLLTLVLEELPSLVRICPQQQNLSEVGCMFSRNCVVILPSFRSMTVEHCPKLLMHSLVRLPLKVFPNSDTDSVTIPLEDLYLYGCSQLEHIISKENIDAHFPLVCFTYLRVISIHDCKKLKTLLPISIISSRSLPQLETLIISRCDELAEVFELENEADNIDEEIQFPKLLTLFLQKLPSLVRFCPQGYHFVFPSLREFKVNECPKMITSFVAASDASVYTKSEASMPGKHVATESAVTLLSPNKDTEWHRFNGEWKEGALL